MSADSRASGVDRRAAVRGRLDPTAASPSRGAVDQAESAAPREERTWTHDVVHRRPRERLVAGVLDWGIFVALTALFVYFSATTEFFLTTQNLLNIGTAVSVTGILAAGITVALIAGQLDLTVGMTMGLATTIIATLQISYGWPLWLAILTALGVGLVVGIVNGFLVVDIGINSIIATIAVSQVLLGTALIVPEQRGQDVYLSDYSLRDFVNTSVLGVPTAIWLAGGVYVVLYVLLTRTRLGWHIYATGGSASASLRAGIRVSEIYRFVFVLTAALAVLAGVVLAGRAGIGGPRVGGDSYTFDALTAVLLGGIGLSGGVGRIERTLAGVLVVGVLQNGLTLNNVDGYYQVLVRGGVLLLAVVLGAIGLKRGAR